MPFKKQYSLQAPSKKSSIEATLFLTIVILFGYVTHQVFFRFGFMMNPDESELLATARLAAMKGGLNENYTTSTYGPIWPEFLASLNLFGMPLDHFRAHQLAFLMKMIIFLPPQYLAIKKNGFLKLSPVLIILNFVLFTPTSNEFSFLATELLPLVFLTIAVIVIVISRSRLSLALVGILYTLSIFSKYQSLLMVFVLIFYIFLRQTESGTFSSKKFKHDLLLFLFSILITICLVLLLLMQSNSLSKFLKESFLLSINYSTVQGFGGGANLIEKFSVGSSLLVGQPLILLASMTLVMVVTYCVAPHVNFEVGLKKVNLIGFSFTSLILFQLVAFLTISIPGNGFPHYLLFYLWSLNIFLLSVNFMGIKDNSQAKNEKFTQSFTSLNSGIMALLLTSILASITTGVPKFKEISNTALVVQNNQTRFDELSKAEILSYCPNGSRVLVWGWSSELFSYFNWTPVSNVVNDVARTKFSQLSEESISRISTEIANKQTDCIYEAIGAQFFGGFGPSEGVEPNSERFLGALNQDYLKVILQDGTSVWTRNR
jgi:hypothetical protein